MFRPVFQPTESHAVTRVNAEGQARAIAALTLAFAEDSANRWCWPDAGDYLKSFPQFVRALGGRAFDTECAFEIAEGAGAALWLPPGVEPDEAALVSLIENSVHASRRDELFAIVEKMGRLHPTFPHWYLPFVGVEPMHQGRGLGAELLRPILQRCDAEGLPAYLESSDARNIPFYERLGFNSVGRIQAGSSPVIVPMLREPQ